MKHKSKASTKKGTGGKLPSPKGCRSGYNPPKAK